MKAKALILIASLAILAGCGKETIREVLVTAPPVEAPAVELSKYDKYLDFLYSESAQSREWSEARLLELGSVVCDSFEAGATLDVVIQVFADNADGSYDTEFYATVMAGAVSYLCPEFEAYVNSQI
jgi:uncharacterized lipoprotein YajG